MSKPILKALLYEMHIAIDESSTHTVDNIKSFDLTYPPGAELTDEESKALASLELSEHAKSGLKKLIKDACAYPPFHLFSLLDGVADPESEELDDWYGLSFTEKNEDDDEMLHDEFYESFWDYKDK